ncbi:MAG: choline-sulfatase, partial [Myxococcota bacterium]
MKCELVLHRTPDYHSSIRNRPRGLPNWIEGAMHNYRKCSSRLACTGARVLLASACLLVLAGCGAEGPRPNVVLITVDTLRSDILAPYSVAASPGNAVGRAVVDVANTPHLSELASSATLFERATAPMSLTRPSHFSIFTGRYPREHGVVNNQIALRAAEETVTELFRDEGYHTGAFVAVSLLGEGSGALQGFDTVAGPSNQLEWAAPRVIDHARKWLQSLPEDEPYFLWVHLFDPHQPYNPPAQERVGLDAELAADYPSIGWGELLEIAKANGGHISQEVLDYSKALYRAEVQAVDASVGLLIETVDSLAAPERTMVVFTADHGECFENGNYFEHSDCLYEGGVRVPLIVRYPAEFAAGERVSSLVSNGDIAPTLLRAAGISVPTTMTSLA